jgi:hypothetical protein
VSGHSKWEVVVGPIRAKRSEAQRARARERVLAEGIIYRLEKAAGWDFGEDLVIEGNNGAEYKVLDELPDWWWPIWE